MATIHVELLDEGVTCWRPVEAEHVGSDAYRITTQCPSGEAWAFTTGDVVRCRLMQLSGDDDLVSSQLVAFEKSQSR